MTLSVETILVVSLMMAVFAAVSTIGSSLFLGAGFERLRAGFEAIKKQTAFFSDAIHHLDTRVETVEKQGGYFFKAISDLEQNAVTREEPAHDQLPRWRGFGDGVSPAIAAKKAEEQLIVATRDDAMHAVADCLLTGGPGFNMPAPRRSLSEQFGQTAASGGIEMPENRAYFH